MLHSLSMKKAHYTKMRACAGPVPECVRACVRASVHTYYEFVEAHEVPLRCDIILNLCVRSCARVRLCVRACVRA